jgi:hypothetical protein
MEKCPICNSTDVVPEKNSEGKKFLHCRNCGKMWTYMRDLDTAAEKALKGIVMGSRLSRIERLSGLLLAALVVRGKNDYTGQMDAHPSQRESAFGWAKRTAERYVDWFDEQNKKEKP